MGRRERSARVDLPDANHENARNRVWDWEGWVPGEAREVICAFWICDSEMRSARRPCGATRRAAMGRIWSKRSTARRVTV